MKFVYDKATGECVEPEELARREEQRHPPKKADLHFMPEPGKLWWYKGKRMTQEEFEDALASEHRSSLPSPQVMRDIQPFRNIAVDGRIISSRSQKREMMRQHNLIEVGTEFRRTKRGRKPTRAEVRQTMKQSLQHLGVI